MRRDWGLAGPVCRLPLVSARMVDRHPQAIAYQVLLQAGSAIPELLEVSNLSGSGD